MNFETVKKHLKSFEVALDIGAHKGESALVYSPHFNMVHSFEPLVSDTLKENVINLGNVLVHDFAVMNYCGEVKMVVWERNTQASYVFCDSNRGSHGWRKDHPSSKSKTVPCRTIDSMRLKAVSFIKIDTEGMVMPVLRGMRKTLMNCMPVIQIEMPSREPFRKEPDEFIRVLGYTLVDKFGAEKKGNLPEYLYTPLFQP